MITTFCSLDNELTIKSVGLQHSVEEIDINSLIKKSIAQLEDDYADFNLKITLNLTNNLPKIMLNPASIMQVILNLARNSIVALQSTSQANPELIIDTHMINERIVVHVINNGPDITPEFENEMITTVSRIKHQEIGLGLHICHSLIGAHGGRLSIYNKNGTWFSFTLPIRVC